MRVADRSDPAQIAIDEAEAWARTADLESFEVEFQRRFVLCPARDGEAHAWGPSRVDEAKPCRFCGKSGRANFNEATRARGELFSRVRAPDSAHGKAKKP